MPERGTAAAARYARNMQWRKEYEEGATLQQISERYDGVYPGTLSRAIQSVGGTMRPTGYRPGEKDRNKPRHGLLGWTQEKPKKEEPKPGLLGWVKS